MINLDALLSAIQERKARAEAAKNANANGSLQLTLQDVTREEGQAVLAFYHDVTLPDDALRRYDRDLRVLERHGNKDGRCEACLFEESDLYGRTYEPWPCIEVRDLAHAYAIPTEDGTP